MTAGFGLTTPPIEGDLGAYPINMMHIVEGMINVPHEEVAYFGDLVFFRQAIQRLAGQGVRQGGGTLP